MPRGVYKRKEVKKVEAAVPEVEVKKTSPIGHPVYVPQPDMGNIKPPPESTKGCGCKHTKETHYGGPYGWCNSPGCECQEFK